MLTKLLKSSLFTLVACGALGACQIKSIGYINDQTSVQDMANASSKFKSATACAYAPLFFYPPIYDYNDNIKIAQAADAAGIKKIAFIQNSSTSFILYSKYCMTAFGN